MVNAQEWLEKYYSDKKTNSIYINQQLEGVLDCSEYKNLRWIFISSSVDSSKFEIKKGSYYSEETKVIPCIPAQEWLDQNYPKNETCIRKWEPWHGGGNHWDFGKTREGIEGLYIEVKGLEGNLDLSDFKNLERLSCSDNCLTSLNINNCRNLKEIRCSNNQFTTLNLNNLEQLGILVCYSNYLTKIPYSPNPERITELIISDNNLSSQNLSIFSRFKNLWNLDIGNHNKNKINQGTYNHFYGSLEPLKDLGKLLWLGINNTDINSGWEHLPDSLEKIWYETEIRTDCKLAQTKEQWDQELWKDIHDDFAPKWKKDWLETGSSKEKTKEWIAMGVDPNRVKFINWFLNFRKLDLDWAKENEEEFKDLRDNYSGFGTCDECQQPNTSLWWCQTCNAKHFQEEFKNWTSGNPKVDEFIQKCQLEATNYGNVLEWIPYEQFTEIEYLTQGGFGKVYKAKWEKGSIRGWDNEKRKWKKKREL